MSGCTLCQSVEDVAVSLRQRHSLLIETVLVDRLLRRPFKSDQLVSKLLLLSELQIASADSTHSFAIATAVVLICVLPSGINTLTSKYG